MSDRGLPEKIRKLEAARRRFEDIGFGTGMCACIFVKLPEFAGYPRHEDWAWFQELFERVVPELCEDVTLCYLPENAYAPCFEEPGTDEGYEQRLECFELMIETLQKELSEGNLSV